MGYPAMSVAGRNLLNYIVNSNMPVSDRESSQVYLFYVKLPARFLKFLLTKIGFRIIIYLSNRFEIKTIRNRGAL